MFENWQIRPCLRHLSEASLPGCGAHLKVKKPVYVRGMGIHLHSTAILYTRARISTSLCIKSGEIKRKTTPETFDRGGRQAIR